MTINESRECPDCGGETEIAYNQYADSITILSNDCDCEIEAVVFYDRLRSWLEGEWESRHEQRIADYHGGSTPFNQAERDEVFRQQNPRGI